MTLEEKEICEPKKKTNIKCAKRADSKYHQLLLMKDKSLKSCVKTNFNLSDGLELLRHQSDTFDSIKTTSFKPLKKQESSTRMSSSAGKNVKNYLYDNPQLKDLKPMIAELDNDLDSSDNEIWLLQCPKSFEPQQLIQKDLENQSKIEFNVDRFYEKKTLAIITPDKAADLVCDSLKLIKPVGKIVLSERLSNFSIESEPLNRSQTAFDSSSNSCSDSCSEVSKPEPANRKKLSKNFKDQKFTIETTVTVEKCGDRKRNKISGQDKYLPLETTSSKKQKNNKKA